MLKVYGTRKTAALTRLLAMYLAISTEGTTLKGNENALPTSRSKQIIYP